MGKRHSLRPVCAQPGRHSLKPTLKGYFYTNLVGTLFWGAWRTIAGYEAIHMIRKGQACWSAAGAKVGLLHRFILDLFAATS